MNVWESMGKPCSCTKFIKSRIIYYKSRENPYQVLQVMCIASDEIKGSYDKMVIIIVPSYTRKNITRLLLLALLLMLRTRNNTDGNKLVIFSGIALYYDDHHSTKLYWKISQDPFSSRELGGVWVRDYWNETL